MNLILLPVHLVDEVLARLGFSEWPEPNLQSLRAIYNAWCRRVPFDNVRKIIHVRSGDPGPLPGSTPVDFFEGWLLFGTGGTCWAGAGALHALLTSIGFTVVRGIGTMLVSPNLPPNHGTVVVIVDGFPYLVDSSILHGEPLPLVESAVLNRSHSAWGVDYAQRDGKWHIRWRPLNRLEGLDCRLDELGFDPPEFPRRYAATRGWSPFNYEVTVRINHGNEVIGVAGGHKVVLKHVGIFERELLLPTARRRFLIEEIGFSEEIVDLLPDDVPTPPPPWSRTEQLMANAS